MITGVALRAGAAGCRICGMDLYDWNNMPAEQLNPSIVRRAVHTETMTIARLLIAKDAVVPEHHHVNEQVATVERGALRFQIGDREVLLGAGQSRRHSVECAA